MDFEIKSVKVKSSDGIHTLRGKIFIPSGEIKGILHLVHGMTEHINRYDSFFAEFAKNGYVCCGYDNLGHGKTVDGKDELGFIAHKKGYDYLMRDVKIFSDKIRKNYPKVPYILMGHSMGSFIVRGTAVNYVTDPDKLIICGTGGSNPFSAAGLLITDILKLFKGEKYISKTVDKIAFGTFNKRFEGDSEYNWLTKDPEVIGVYSKDELCTFKFTVSAMHDLVKLNRIANSKKFFKKLDKSIPVLIVSGDSDPVGDYSKGVKKVYNRLKDGRDVTLKLYENCRHEIHNDTCKNEMIEDILEFLEK